MITGMLQIFPPYGFVLLDLGFTLSYVSTYVAVNFNFYLENVLKPFSASTPFDESIIAKRV